jgi:hypothetical protein
MEIDDPELSKPDCQPCVHLMTGRGCAIQDRKPRTCRTWFCGWRFLHLSDAVRPDRCGVMLAPEPGATPGFEKGGLRVVLVDGDRHGLLNDELLDLLARCVTGGRAHFPFLWQWAFRQAGADQRAGPTRHRRGRQAAVGGNPV